jgi:hypothetical protein
MRTRLGIVISSVALAIAGGLLLTTSASGQTVIHLTVSIDGNRIAIDDPQHDGLGLGDRLTARGPLLDESQTDRVGTTYMGCLVHRRIIDPDRGLWNCNYVLELEDGEIMLQGLDPRGPGVYEMAVIGGTGAYAGANGDATFTDVGGDADGYTDMVIRLGG